MTENGTHGVPRKAKQPLEEQTNTVYGTAEFPWASPFNKENDDEATTTTKNSAERTPLSQDDGDVFTTRGNGAAASTPSFLPRQSHEDYREPRVINVTAELVGSAGEEASTTTTMGSSPGSGGDNHTIYSTDLATNDAITDKNGLHISNLFSLLLFFKFAFFSAAHKRSEIARSKAFLASISLLLKFVFRLILTFLHRNFRVALYKEVKKF